jgi:hypothetical protein
MENVMENWERDEIYKRLDIFESQMKMIQEGYKWSDKLVEKRGNQVNHTLFADRLRCGKD